MLEQQWQSAGGFARGSNFAGDYYKMSKFVQFRSRLGR
jgi:hypothetical protein